MVHFYGTTLKQKGYSEENMDKITRKLQNLNLLIKFAIHSLRIFVRLKYLHMNNCETSRSINPKFIFLFQCWSAPVAVFSQMFIEAVSDPDSG